MSIRGPKDFDADESERWLPIVGEGSKAAFAVIERFIATIDSPGLALRLRTEVNGSGAFQRFHAELRRHDDEYARWHGFRPIANRTAITPPDLAAFFMGVLL